MELILDQDFKALIEWPMLRYSDVDLGKNLLGLRTVKNFITLVAIRIQNLYSEVSQYRILLAEQMKSHGSSPSSRSSQEVYLPQKQESSASSSATIAAGNDGPIEKLPVVMSCHSYGNSMGPDQSVSNYDNKNILIMRSFKN
jgi:hypothetical protein